MGGEYIYIVGKVKEKAFEKGDEKWSKKLVKIGGKWCMEGDLVLFSYFIPQ